MWPPAPQLPEPLTLVSGRALAVSPSRWWDQLEVAKVRPHPSTCPGLWHRSSGPLDLILPHRCQGPGHAQRPCVQHPAPGTMGARPPAPPRDAPRLPLRGSSCPLPRRSPAALIWEFWLVSVPASASRMICWDGASWAGSCPARAGRGAGGIGSTHSPGDPGRVTPGHHRPPAWVPSQAVGTGMRTGTPVPQAYSWGVPPAELLPPPAGEGPPAPPWPQPIGDTTPGLTWHPAAVNSGT